MRASDSSRSIAARTPNCARKSWRCWRSRRRGAVVSRPARSPAPRRNANHRRPGRSSAVFACANKSAKVGWASCILPSAPTVSSSWWRSSSSQPSWPRPLSIDSSVKCGSWRGWSTRRSRVSSMQASRAAEPGSRSSTCAANASMPIAPLEICRRPGSYGCSCNCRRPCRRLMPCSSSTATSSRPMCSSRRRDCPN